VSIHDIAQIVGLVGSIVALIAAINANYWAKKALKAAQANEDAYQAARRSGSSSSQAQGSGLRLTPCGKCGERRW